MLITPPLADFVMPCSSRNHPMGTLKGGGAHFVSQLAYELLQKLAKTCVSGYLHSQENTLPSKDGSSPTDS